MKTFQTKLLSLFFGPIAVMTLTFCGKKPKEMEPLISPNFASEIQGQWMLSNFEMFVEYGVIGLNTTADLKFKNAIDSANFCDRNISYLFAERNQIKIFTDTTCQTDSTFGSWLFDPAEKILTLNNTVILPPYSGRLLNSSQNISTDTLTVFSTIYSVEKANKYEIVLSEVFQESLTKERWDNNREQFEALLGDIRNVLPIDVSSKSTYTLRRKTL